MKGRYLHALKDASRVTVLWISLGLVNMGWGLNNNASDSIHNVEFIIKVSEAEGLEGIAARAGAEVEPLITYPNPSQEVLDLFGNYYLVGFPEERQSAVDSLVDVLSSLPWVQHLEPNATVSIDVELESIQEMIPFSDPGLSPYIPNDPFFPYQWSREVTQTPRAWSISTGSPDVVIAILDTGVDPDHPDLVANLVLEYNFVDNDTNFADDNGHGTKVAGSAAAKIDNSVGIAGVAGNASIMPLKVANSMGNMSRSAEINAILYAVDNTADVINVSAGFCGPSEPEEAAIEYAWSKGLFICASAGNDGRYDPNHYPSAYTHVMSVGACNKEDARAEFSNHGENVDVYAPGQSVWQTLAGGGYGTATGTSYASPQIAGLAALIWSAYPSYTNQQLWEMIILGCDTIDSDEGNVLRMNAVKAITTEPRKESNTAETQDGLFIISAASLQARTMSFAYEVPSPTSYILKVFDATGKAVCIQKGRISASGKINFNARFPCGSYFWRFEIENGVHAGKIVLLN